MTTTKLIALWPQSLAKGMRKWLLRRKLAHIRYSLDHIREQDEHNRHAKRILQGQQAVISSELRLL